MKTNQLFPSVLILVGFWITTGSSITMAQNQSGIKRLPPPPTIPAGNRLAPAPQGKPVQNPLPVELTPVGSQKSSVIREYTFQAPQTPRANIPPVPRAVPTVSPKNPNPSIVSTKKTPRTVGGFYRVMVVGNNETVLSKVKTIEPLAFIRAGEGVIQAGMFDKAEQAQERVKNLAKNGLSAKIVQVTYITEASTRQRLER